METLKKRFTWISLLVSYRKVKTSLAFGHNLRMCSLSSKMAPHSPQLGLVVMCLQARVALVSSLSCSSNHVKVLICCGSLKCQTELHIGCNVMFCSFLIIAKADLMEKFPNGVSIQLKSSPTLSRIKSKEAMVLRISVGK